MASSQENAIQASGVAETLSEFLSNEILEGLPVASDTTLFTSGLLDSFHLVEILMFVEEQYGVRIDSSEIRPEFIDTPASLGDLVVSKVRV